MRVAIRADASRQMGTGHLRRCLSLAAALHELGAQVSLVCRQIDSVSQAMLADCAYPVLWLPPSATANPALGDTVPSDHQAWATVSWQQDAQQTQACLQSWQPDWLVIDHYAFDAQWHEHLRAALGCELMAVDDLGDRPLSVDLLLDPNVSADPQAKYATRLTPNTRCFTGPRFALLSSAYRDPPRYTPNATVRSIGIFLGGVDAAGLSAKVLAVCRRDVGFAGVIEVASTSANPSLGTLHAACNHWPNTQLTLDQSDLAAFFARHDLQIGAGGGATLERCRIGVPSIALIAAANQIPGVLALALAGAVAAASLPVAEGESAGSSLPPLADTLSRLLTDTTARLRLGELSSRLVDGRGAQRAALALMRECLSLRAATAQDTEMLLAWRNHESVRSVSVQSDEIALPDHQRWLAAVLATPTRWLWIAQIGALAVGSLRFDQQAPGRLQVSLMIDHALHSLGLGARMLLRGEQTMGKLLAHAFDIDALVLPGNTNSQRLFARCGYQGAPWQFRKRVPGPESGFSEGVHEDS